MPDAMVVRDVQRDGVVLRREMSVGHVHRLLVRGCIRVHQYEVTP